MKSWVPGDYALFGQRGGCVVSSVGGWCLFNTGDVVIEVRESWLERPVAVVVNPDRTVTLVGEESDHH